MDVMCKKISAVVGFGADGAVVTSAEVLEDCRILVVTVLACAG